MEHMKSNLVYLFPNYKNGLARHYCVGRYLLEILTIIIKCEPEMASLVLLFIGLTGTDTFYV